MNLKSHSIFTLYTIYGILFKGEAGMSGARVCVMCVCARMLQASSRAGLSGRTRGHTRVLAGRRGARALSQGFSFSCTCGSVPARDCVRALNVRAYVCETARGGRERERDGACPVTLGISHGC